MHRSAVLILSASAAALIAGGCASSAHQPPASTSSEAAMKHKTGEGMRHPQATPAKATTVKVVSSQSGAIVADARGQALYLFSKDKAGRTQCFGACASNWPPAITKGTLRGASGARSALLGTTPRGDGQLQLTYAGHPLYYYRGDGPGHVLCQNANEFGGLWLVVRPNGAAVR